MKIVKEISAIQDISDHVRCLGKKIALVPTMGFLHEGHTSLMLKAKNENDILVTSIFVNPTQFGKNEDFDKYPRDITEDYNICEKAGVDYIFNPEVEEMYKEKNYTSVAVSDISEKLEGKFRPGHFTGVATVVLKLLNAVKADKLYLGQKDAQQNVIIKKVIEDLNVDVEVIICPTLREENGLAMSSRNSYLSEDQKNKASVLNYILKEGKKLILENNISDPAAVKNHAVSILKERTPEMVLQYYEITDNTELEPVNNLDTYNGEILISLAAYSGTTRLIDNIIFKNNNLH
ncbi:MAG: pantoate--beta-alanine ligase [Bacteroidota bacterium]|nr:pantoate--beta-alanine ligase [Bacteroidota bacterium]